MIFTKDDTGVFISGATVHNPTEQTFAVLEFAVANGYEMDTEALETAKKSYELDYDSLGYDWFEALDWELESAVAYLNTKCAGEGVAFTFRDTDFVLIGYNDLDSNYDSVVE
jgi:hypothetical protein